jgi:hypothetical protein
MMMSPTQIPIQNWKNRFQQCERSTLIPTHET